MSEGQSVDPNPLHSLRGQGPLAALGLLQARLGVPPLLSLGRVLAGMC